MPWTLGAWGALLKSETQLPYFKDLQSAVCAAYESATVYPPQEELFSAFHLTSPEQVRVVILGQDPYHEPNQAHGLAFSVKSGVTMPPSLRNIGKELLDDVNLPLRDGCLIPWAKQGVLLLNAVLTVEQGKANSHRDFGWQRFTDAVFAKLSDLPQPIVFVLWGAQAQKKAAVAANSSYPRLVLQAPHPSPLSSYRGFFGSKPFSQINAFLQSHGEMPIDWQI